MHHIKKLLFVGVLSLTSMTTKAAIFVASGNGDSNLYIIDETGAIVETVGDTGEFFTGLAYSVSEAVLYGTTTPNSTTPSSVFRIDIDTAQATLLGAHGVDAAIIDLSFSPTGVLYGWAEPGVDDLVTIDLSTGVATQLPNPEDSAGRTIEFTPDGNIALFNLVQAVIYDPVSGLVTGDTITLNGSGDGGSSEINASYRTSTGIAYAINARGRDGDRFLYSIDFTTGETTQLGQINIVNASAITSDFLDPTLNPDDPAFVAAAPATPVPTLPVFGLLALGGLLGLFGVRQLKA